MRTSAWQTFARRTSAGQTSVWRTSSGHLRGAILRGADLSRARLRGATLRGADLSRARLGGADLSRADLIAANFDQAVVGYTVFGDNDLSETKGLETVQHTGPSLIGIDTIYKSKGKIPEIFLRGAGVPDTFIAYISSLTGSAVEFYSHGFISYSTKDQEFADRLYADLQSTRCRTGSRRMTWLLARRSMSRSIRRLWPAARSSSAASQHGERVGGNRNIKSSQT